MTELQRQLDAANTLITKYREETASLRQQLEIERMRLAACGVVANANTPESAAKAREMLPEYSSASCDDVARAVDREMELRQQLAEYEKYYERVAIEFASKEK